MSTERSRVAAGFLWFAAVMMLIVGAYHAIAGFAGIFEDEIYRIAPAIDTGASGDVYFLQFDATAWGWIHLVVGILIGLAALGLFSGAVWARTVGVILAALSAIANFAWLPWYPVWSIAMIAVAITVIWALTVHGRDIAD